MVDLELQRRTRFQRALLDGADMDEEIAGLLLGVGDAETHALTGHDAGIPDLTTGFAVKRRLVQNQRAALTELERIDFRAVLDQRAHNTLGGFGLITEELGGAEFFAQRKPDAFAGGI